MSRSMLSSLTLKHVYGGLSVVLHGVHEDEWQELGEHDTDLGPDQLVCDHLSQERGGLLTDSGVL